MKTVSFKTAPISRRKGGNAVRSAAYRSGTALRDHRTYELYDRWSRRTDVVYSEILLPDFCFTLALMDRETLWNRVESSEHRRDAQLARDWLFPLHQHMPLWDNVDMIRAYLSEHIVSQGIIADLNVHNPPQTDARNGPLHAHVMTTLRVLDGVGNFGHKNLELRGPRYLYLMHNSWGHFVRSFMVKKCLTAD